jgi:hypothetical protein
VTTGMRFPRSFAFVILSAIVVMVAGCASTPIYPSWRPWYRVLEGTGQLPPPGTPLQVVVDGTTEPLVGDESPSGHC